MTLYWIRWYYRGDLRPANYPPKEEILGYWHSGSEGNDEILCAVVRSKSEQDAKRAIAQEWPDPKDWSFVETREEGWIPGNRFPLENWMVDRFAPRNKSGDIKVSGTLESVSLGTIPQGFRITAVIAGRSFDWNFSGLTAEAIAPCFAPLANGVGRQIDISVEAPNSVIYRVRTEPGKTLTVVIGR